MLCNENVVMHNQNAGQSLKRSLYSLLLLLGRTLKLSPDPEFTKDPKFNYQRVRQGAFGSRILCRSASGALTFNEAWMVSLHLVT